MKYSADKFSTVGDQYLGYSYEKMDCQKFVERCMADVGYHKDLPGSNAWYRAMDWTGTPEECVKEFGTVPKGALLFILEQDGREPEKYKSDHIGNASHIGIKTGRGEGAIHSSKSKGCVCESKFKDRSINGGWNRVGLLKSFDYGNSINWVLDHQGSKDTGKDEGGSKVEERTGTVYAENGKPVNMRKAASTDAALLERVPVGTEVTILSESGDWYKIKLNGQTGWMMKKFITTDDEPIADDPDEDEDFSDFGDDEVDENESAKLLAEIYQELGKLRNRIEKVIGRG